MNTIVLYIRNAKLRMKVIRILMKNDFITSKHQIQMNL